MRDKQQGNHFHGVNICRTCGEIEVGVVCSSEEDMRRFCDVMIDEIENGKAPDGITAEVLIPYEAYIMTAGPDHDFGHDSLFMFHQCSDPFDYCFEQYTMYMARKLAAKLGSSLSNAFKNTMERKNKPVKDDTLYKNKSQKILESLDLPDDLFKGMN